MTIATEIDFETQVLEAGVNVLFKPTKSHYSFLRLSGGHVSRFGVLSRKPSIRHAGPTGDTGDYRPVQVLEMAYLVASKADDAFSEVALGSRRLAQNVNGSCRQNKRRHGDERDER